jgi:hypothetical protein
MFHFFFALLLLSHRQALSERSCWEAHAAKKRETKAATILLIVH